MADGRSSVSLSRSLALDLKPVVPVSPLCQWTFVRVSSTAGTRSIMIAKPHPCDPPTGRLDLTSLNFMAFRRKERAGGGCKKGTVELEMQLRREAAALLEVQLRRGTVRRLVGVHVQLVDGKLWPFPVGKWPVGVGVRDLLAWQGIRPGSKERDLKGSYEEVVLSPSASPSPEVDR